MHTKKKKKKIYSDPATLLEFKKFMNSMQAKETLTPRNKKKTATWDINAYQNLKLHKYMAPFVKKRNHANMQKNQHLKNKTEKEKNVASKILRGTITQIVWSRGDLEMTFHYTIARQLE